MVDPTGLFNSFTFYFLYRCIVDRFKFNCEEVDEYSIDDDDYEPM